MPAQRKAFDPACAGRIEPGATLFGSEMKWI
jgi:hypothetical protein